ncbi:unnamed protein product [Cochlearia groenlandica]
MVLKDSKLYLLSVKQGVTVFDFSVDDSPREVANFPFTCRLSYLYGRDTLTYNLGVTLSGEVLIVLNKVKPKASDYYFTLYKLINPKSSEWRKVNSIGHEVLLLDLGVTVAPTVSHQDGIVLWNCIYFGNDKHRRYNGTSLCNEDNCICICNFWDERVPNTFQWLTKSPPVPFKDARWFFPTFSVKWLL